MRKTVDFGIPVFWVTSWSPSSSERESSSRIMKVLRTTGTEYLPDEFDFLAAIFLAAAGLFLDFVTSASISPSKHCFNRKDRINLLCEAHHLPVVRCERLRRYPRVPAPAIHR